MLRVIKRIDKVNTKISVFLRNLSDNLIKRYRNSLKDNRIVVADNLKVRQAYLKRCLREEDEAAEAKTKALTEDLMSLAEYEMKGN